MILSSSNSACRRSNTRSSLRCKWQHSPSPSTVAGSLSLRGRSFWLELLTWRFFRCKNSVFVDRKEYEQTELIVCPLQGCSYAWCKACSQQIDIGGPQHSCDGSSELRHLMNERGWKYCPGRSFQPTYTILVERSQFYALYQDAKPLRKRSRVVII